MNENFEIKTEGPRTRLEAAAHGLYPIIPYNIIMTIFTSYIQVIVSYSALGIGLYLCYRMNVTSQLKKERKL